MAEAQIPEILARLKKTFASGKTRDVKWRRTQIQGMANLLTENREALIAAMLADGKCQFEVKHGEIAFSLNEIGNALENFEDWLQVQGVGTNLTCQPAVSQLVLQPLGVVCIMSPWNWPIQLTLLPMLGAIAAGCCALIRPAMYCESFSTLFCKLFPKYFDPDAFQCVMESIPVTTAILAERWDKIFFTGGKMVGKLVAESAARHLTPIDLELGGQNPCLIHESADIDIAAKRAMWGVTMTSGQTCVRPNYLLVHTSVADEFIKKSKAYLVQFYGEDASKTKDLARMVNDRAFNRVTGLLKRDAKYVIYGGKNDPASRYIEPTLADFGTDKQAFLNSAMMSEEIFGPAAPIYRYSTLDEAFAIINTLEKPLASYMFATNTAASTRFINEILAGMTCINDVVVHGTNAELPFGGVGHSGMGRYRGKMSVECFSHQKGTMWRYNFADVPFRYPPYDSTKDKLCQVLLTRTPSWPLALANKFLSHAKNLSLLWFLYVVVLPMLRTKLNM